MTQRAYRGREPSSPMTASSVLEVVDLLESEDIDVWLDGGWGVDALLGQETRSHDDLDLVLELAHSERVVELLQGNGYEPVDGAPPRSFVLVDSVGRQVDVHPVTFDSSGGGVYAMERGKWVYPAEGFRGSGTVAGRPVRCLTPEVQVLVHAGYELTEKDYLELHRLHERFGVELPPELLDEVRSAATAERARTTVWRSAPDAAGAGAYDTVTSSFVNCVRRSRPSSVTRTRSSIRTPPSPGR